MAVQLRQSGRQSGKRVRTANARRLAQAKRLHADGAFAAAATIYGQILERDSAHLAALRGRAAALLAGGRDADALCAVALQCSAQGLYDTAARCYACARDIDPDSRDAVWGLADCSASLADDTAAIEGYRRYLELEPGEPEALHMLAALGAGPVPPRAADGFVTDYFDRFADGFDSQLVDDLSYRVPEHLFAATSRFLGEARGQLAILDLGCGTGLSGQLFRGHAARLDGVDLSPRMLDKARGRGVYDTLSAVEIGRYLAETDRRYDLVVAGDVLAYFGALDDVFRGVVRALQPAGLFVFSVETDDIEDYRLTASGRYAHGWEYIRRAAETAGLHDISFTREQLRLEYGEPVEGDIWVLEKAV